MHGQVLSDLTYRLVERRIAAIQNKDCTDFADTRHHLIVEIGVEHLALGRVPRCFEDTGQLTVLLRLADRVLDALIYGLARNVRV